MQLLFIMTFAFMTAQHAGRFATAGRFYVLLDSTFDVADVDRQVCCSCVFGSF